ncbi:LOW QUALITY PROTEIN: DNA repair protein complementing XP-C cells [Alosa alosa]|uniref:LOW QUALITY PROTEIN: DNA repair protein complementing XP-C cells n=1 Tax=Alosa alosa TaxID=278164 RepID=UPI0020154FC5|nr:LOW QUALITY PROTEIN: DNA repair protein complementing XP-C cells [Alosa alosa]
MAKHKGPADVAVKSDTTKKLKQVAAAKGKVGRGKISQKIAENGVKEVPKKSKAKSQTSKKAGSSSAKKHTSKYFQDQPMKREPETMNVDADNNNEDDDDDFIVPAVAVASGVKKTETKKEEEDDEECEDDSDEDGDWEEVEELTEPLGPAAPVEPAVPSQPVEIEIETPDIARKRQQKEKRKTEFENYLRRMMNRFNKDLIEDTHKVHLLCLLANGIFRNSVCREPDLIAITLSLLPSHFIAVNPNRVDTLFLNDLSKWFGTTFTVNPELPEEKGQELRTVLERRLGSLTARNHEEMTHLFLLVLRALQLFCRLVLSLQPLPIKPPPAKDKAKTSKSAADKKTGTSKKSLSDMSSPEAKVSPGSKRPAAGRWDSKTERGGKRPKKRDGTGEKEGTGQRPKNTKRRSVASKVSYKDESSDEEMEEEEAGSEEEFLLSSGGESEEEEQEQRRGGLQKGRGGKGKGAAKGKGRAPRTSSGAKKKMEEEEEGEGEEMGKKRGKRRQGKGNDEWLEVYLEEVGRWVCVDVEQGVGQVQRCSSQATQPISYVVAVDGDGYIKDLSSRYDPTWLTSSRKRRVEGDWWDETLLFYEAPDSEREKKEDNELEARLLSKPLPTAISEYKNHPLYALKRHLLKYEALYPSTAAILGYCRGEPVYSRDCVHTLHSRDTWLKEARTVRLGEVPYKMVKGFSNRSRKARSMAEQKEEKDLSLFGEWQTEEYQPPLAVDGKVPRNDFGNVYLFKPCMLPIGCAHLRLPNLHRVARKLEIDCALAVTGFDFHGGYSHAVTDGYIVCEEHQEILRAAWENEQEIQQKKEIEKREKRAVANWTLLVKGLLIRERLKRRYGQQGLAQQRSGVEQGEQGGTDGLSSEEEEAEEEGKGGGPSANAPSLASSWPQNRQEEPEEASKQASSSKREKRGQQKHLFPFEKV